MTGYYPQSLPPPQHAMGVTSSPHNQPLRYPLPQPDGRIMSGGRHKKEIKRRTKTGCLTCRKRRIKVRLSSSPNPTYFPLVHDHLLRPSFFGDKKNIWSRRLSFTETTFLRRWNRLVLLAAVASERAATLDFILGCRW